MFVRDVIRRHWFLRSNLLRGRSHHLDVGQHALHHSVPSTTRTPAGTVLSWSTAAIDDGLCRCWPRWTRSSHGAQSKRRSTEGRVIVGVVCECLRTWGQPRRPEITTGTGRLSPQFRSSFKIEADTVALKKQWYLVQYYPNTRSCLRVPRCLWCFYSVGLLETLSFGQCQDVERGSVSSPKETWNRVWTRVLLPGQHNVKYKNGSFHGLSIVHTTRYLYWNQLVRFNNMFKTIPLNDQWAVLLSTANAKDHFTYRPMLIMESFKQYSVCYNTFRDGHTDVRL